MARLLRKTLAAPGSSVALWVALCVNTSQCISIGHADGRDNRDGHHGIAHVSNQSVAQIPWPAVAQLVKTEVVPRTWPTIDAVRGVRHVSVSKLKDSAAEYWILLAVSISIWIILVVLAAYMYRGADGYFPEIGPFPKDPAATRRQLSKWQFAWYHCASDPEVCFWSCCCPWIRWAHTMDLLHVMEYGPAFAVFFMLELVNRATAFMFIGVYFTMLLVYYRQKVRQVFGMQNYGTVAGILEDWFCLCFCMPCTIAQEAQHVKFAAEMGYPLPACMAENAGRRKTASNSNPSDEDPELGSSSSQSGTFHDVISKVSGSCRDSPALPQSEPHSHVMVFGGIFGHSRSRSSSRGIFRSANGNGSRSSRRRSRSSSWDRRQTPKSSPTPKAKGLAHNRGGVSSSIAPRASWHREAQNPMPERLLAPPPVHPGELVEVNTERLGFVQVLETLHDDLRAYVFLFVEVGCVGSCGASCRTLHEYIWSDRAFWHFYCGPSVNDRLAQPWYCQADALREAFRRWIFHIDGVWTKDFREFIDQARHSPSGADLSLMLSYARYIASGLMPYDSRPAVAEFTNIMCELLGEYNPERHDERNAAEAMTAQVECMAEVFTGAQIKMILSAFDCSLGRAVSAHSEAESDMDPPWMAQGDQNIMHPTGQELEEDLVDPPWGDHAVLWFG